jgi:hypothetical protein
MRKGFEVSMLTYEAIEVHLASLHAGQDELREDVRELRTDTTSLRDTIDAVDAKLSQQITQLSDAVASIRGLQKATIWLMWILGSPGTVGKILHWS